MEKLFKLINKDSWKSLYVDSEKIYLSSKAFTDSDAFVKHFPEKGILAPSKDSFAINRVHRLEYMEGSSDLILQFGSEKRTLNFDHQYALEDFVTYISEKRGLVCDKVAQSRLMGFLPSLGIIGFALLASGFLYYYASVSANGETIELTGSGKTKLFTLLIIKLSGFLGTNGSLALGIVGLLWGSYQVFNEYKNPTILFKIIYKLSR
ncbi:MAG: hypothetical protein U0V72_08390 [Cytophagales bacterium]